MNPRFETWVLIYRNDNFIGYIHTYKEAEDYCKKNNDCSWEYAKMVIKNKKERDKLYVKLNMVI